MPNKLNTRSEGIFFSFLGIFVPFLDNTFCDEFDKMQIQYEKEYCHIPDLYIVCLATT